MLTDAAVGTSAIAGELPVRRLGFAAMPISGARNVDAAWITLDADEISRIDTAAGA